MQSRYINQLVHCPSNKAQEYQASTPLNKVLSGIKISNKYKYRRFIFNIFNINIFNIFVKYQEKRNDYERIRHS